MLADVRVAAVLARPQLRHGWRDLIGIALLIALAGGLALGALAAADRTASAVDRMIAETDSFDVKLNPTDRMDSALDFDEIGALPGVASAHRIFGLIVIPDDLEPTVDVFNAAPFALVSDGVALLERGRPVLESGRLPDPSAADEVYVEQSYADARGIRAGDSLAWRFPSYDDLGRIFSVADERELAALYADPDFGDEVIVTVTGTGREIEAITVDEGLEPVPIWTTPALLERLESPSPIFWAAGVALEDPTTADRFREDVDALVPDEIVVYESLETIEDRTERAALPGAVALAVFASVVAVLGLLLIGQAVSRRLQLDARDNDVYAVIGTTRLQRFGASMLRVLVTTVTGTVLAVVVAWMTSWFAPVGPARRAEVHRGLSFHPWIAWGALVLLAAVLVVSSVPAWRSARRSIAVGAPRGSAFASWLGSMGAAPSTTTGIRFGLEPGRGSTAVPTRASIIGATTAVAITVSTVVFASSLDLVVSDSRFYGSNFDDVVEVGTGGRPLAESDRLELLDRIRDDPAVVAASEQRVGDVEVDGVQLPAFALSGGPPSVEPTLASGRAPSASNEIALGSLTMDRLNVDIGDQVTVAGGQYDGTAQVVGQVVLPGLGYHRAAEKTTLGSGALVVPEVLDDPLAIDDTAQAMVIVSDLDTDDLADFRARIGNDLAAIGTPLHTAVAQPSDIRSLGDLRSLVVVLVVALLGLVAATVVHAMVVAVRRRRRDLAVLETIGATSRDLRRVGIWQGVTVGVAALLFGVPIGVVIGRWSWIAMAEGFGTLAEPVVPWIGVVVVIASVIALSAAVGVVPVQRGLRLRPSEVLRSE